MLVFKSLLNLRKYIFLSSYNYINYFLRFFLLACFLSLPIEQALSKEILTSLFLFNKHSVKKFSLFISYQHYSHATFGFRFAALYTDRQDAMHPNPQLISR